VRQAYLSMADKNPQRYKIIDASQTINLVQQQIADSLDYFLRVGH
jgi:thymidylate kinase